MKNRDAASSTLRRIKDGDVIGSMEPDGTHAWRGIRFAAPPVGPLRWRAPQPVQPWAGVYEALGYLPMAPQYAGLLAPVPKATHGRVVGSEDCLGLNVFAPAWERQDVPRGAQRRPVMVWIHGGGNAVGTAESYEVLRNYAAHDDLIVVTVNYRLGILGWLALPLLNEGEDTTEQERSGNFGTLDLIAALHWVRDNIEAFGGDPGQVTVFGQSAGGQNVLTLLASPLAAGLFHRAIAQSPVANTYSLEEATLPNDDPIKSLRATASELSRRWMAIARETPNAALVDAGALSAKDTAKLLRSLSPAQLLSAVQPGTAGIYLGPRPIRDGLVLPSDPLPQVFASGRWNRMPVIIGSTRDEYRTFLADKPEHARMVWGAVPILRNRRAYAVESGYLSRAWKALNVDRIADAMLASGHEEIWTYRFDWDEAPAVPFIRPDLLLGAAHGMEMPFVFRDVRGEFDLFGVNTPFNKRGRVALSDAMGLAWTSFARHGRPGLAHGTQWSPRSAARNRPDSLVFDTEHGGGIRMEFLRDEIGSLKQGLLDDASLEPDLRCRIYARLFLWSPLYAGHGSVSEFEQWCLRLGCKESPEKFRPIVEI
ncbi:MAG: carboxylesterase/lipase family protein [Pigmentiphaga sp.]|uniref:carboxylesterase/lipase family protein n=1 Tax=Pigmentiphaga sp. TaxID=1977564 RepID=UPI003B53F418